tara:strand:- start:298 stop:507 length:210 start_codon:yes stop_codon:yes gene_type:complete
MAKGTKHINHGVKVDDDAQVFVSLQSAAPTDADIASNEIVFYLDEDHDKLMVRLKYADGTAKDGELALT